MFLANMSHEIRTPMNAVLGFAQLMQRDPALTPKQAEHLNIINRNGEHLLGLINDILEMSKIEAGRVAIDLESFDICQLLQDLEQLFRMQTDAKGLGLSLRIDPAVPRLIVSDQRKLRQIVINLLGNAVKFTKHGAITIRATTMSDGPDRERLNLTVADTGSGIASDELEAVFAQYQQTSSGRRSHGGTGLGLALSREYSRLLGGDVTVTSHLGRGSVFRVEIAYSRCQTVTHLEDPLPREVCGVKVSQPAPRILIVDDSAENRLLLSHVLKPFGFELHEACDGLEAVKEFAAWKPNLILMDLAMPRMDGYEAIQAIRRQRDGQQVKILVITASAFEESRKEVMEVGSDGFLRKPFRHQELFQLLHTQLNLELIVGRSVGTAPVRVSSASEGPIATTEKLLSSLPTEVIEQVHQATVCADFDRLQQLLRELEGLDKDLVTYLRSMANNFEYETLARLFSTSKGKI